MAKKKKQPKKTAPHAASTKTQRQGAGAMATGPRRTVLALVLGGLVVVFVTSFVYRMDHTLERKVVPRQEQEHGDEGQQQTMPPATGGGMDAMTGQNGEGMDEIRSLMTRMRENPNDPDVLVALSKRFLGMGDVQSAKSFLERALVADPANVEAMSLLGMAHFEAGEHAEAAKLLRRLVEVDADNATHHFNLGMVEMHFLDETEIGRERLETALSLAGEDSALAERIRRELETHDHDHEEPGAQNPPQPDDAPGAGETGRAANATGS